MSLQEPNPSARAFGERHETKPRRPDESTAHYQRAKIMDLHNNSSGIDFADAFQGVPLASGSRSTANRCQREARIDSGLLWFLIPFRRGLYT